MTLCEFVATIFVIGAGVAIGWFVTGPLLIIFVDRIIRRLGL